MLSFGGGDEGRRIMVVCRMSTVVRWVVLFHLLLVEAVRFISAHYQQPSMIGRLAARHQELPCAHCSQDLMAQPSQQSSNFLVLSAVACRTWHCNPTEVVWMHEVDSSSSSSGGIDLCASSIPALEGEIDQRRSIGIEAECKRMN